MSVAYSVRTQGYPQTSGILTTAYEATDIEARSMTVMLWPEYAPNCAVPDTPM